MHLKTDKMKHWQTKEYEDFLAKNKPEVVLSKSQRIFYDAVMTGQNVWLKGKAGTGKTWITKLVVEALESRGKKVIVMAPTGIAATNIGGATLHSTFGLSPHGVLTFESCNFLKTEKRRVLDAADVLVIDEVSMMRADILDGLNWTLIKNGCSNLQYKQIIFIGDMKQLKAVADDNMKSVMLGIYDGVEFHNAKIFEKLNILEIDLVEMQRQSDPEFIENLNIVRDGQKAPYFRKFFSEEPHGIILAPHNSTVNRYNMEGLQKQEGKKYTFNAEVSDNVKASDFNLESQIQVKDGCKIMYLINSKNNNLVNGTMGIFRQRTTSEGFDQYFIEVKGVQYLLEIIELSKKEYVLNQEENKLELKEIGSIKQYPFKLAYALTIHKSQGLTFENATIDLSLPCFVEGQLYVALSRLKSPEGLRIIQPIKNLNTGG